jgi:predicted MFS family arabinose efflux permease
MNPDQKITQRAFIWTSVLKAPFWSLYGLLVFILYKDLHATAFQVAMFLALKPVVSIFSIYWSQFIVDRRDRLISNIIVAGILGYLPFFFFPFVNNPWFFIFSGALYLMLMRGIVPAWMEILKINLPSKAQGKIFSYGASISYLGGIILPLFLGDALDIYPGIWKWLFPATAVLGLLSMFFQLRIPIPQSTNSSLNTSPDLKVTHKSTCIHFLLQPWKMSCNLFKERADFRQFQIGFFLGGMGLMLMQPALPHFFFDTLKVSYIELAVALSVCKGIGFTLTTRFWASLLNKIPIFKFSAIVISLAAFFPLCLLLAENQLIWLYISYLIYGIMQAGSELSWHLSGPIFAKMEDSSSFSSANVAMVGLRGCIAPFLGSLLVSKYNPFYVLLLAAILGILAAIKMQQCNKKMEKQLS